VKVKHIVSPNSNDGLLILSVCCILFFFVVVYLFFGCVTVMKTGENIIRITSQYILVLKNELTFILPKEMITINHAKLHFKCVFSFYNIRTVEIFDFMPSKSLSLSKRAA